MMLADQSQTRPISDKKWLIPERLTVLPSEKENGMGAKERITRELIMAHLRSLERQGFVVPSVDPDGQVRWRITEKGRREDPNEMDSRLDLDS
jgi:DNA-binding MarR family transcriptional regulator